MVDRYVQAHSHPLTPSLVVHTHQKNPPLKQIKNSVRTAQALAVNENCPLSMDHIKRVLEVAETFDQDLRGGTGYLDAMRSYT